MEHVVSARTVGLSLFPARWLANHIALWLTVWRERRALERLDDRMLSDIGIDRYTAQREVERPMWDVPLQRLPF